MNVRDTEFHVTNCEKNDSFCNVKYRSNIPHFVEVIKLNDRFGM